VVLVAKTPASVAIAVMSVPVRTTVCSASWMRCLTSCLHRVAAPRCSLLSARTVPQAFEAADDRHEVASHFPVGLGDTVTSGLGAGGDEGIGFLELTLMQRQEFDGGVEVRAGEAGVGVRTALLCE
jgi:hypothetical protein